MASVDREAEEMSEAEHRQAAKEARGLRVAGDGDTGGGRTRTETFGGEEGDAS